MALSGLFRTTYYGRKTRSAWRTECRLYRELCSNVKLLAELNQMQDVHFFVMYVLNVIALQDEMSVWLTSICLTVLRRKLIYIM
jgi:hypothetical protein